MQIPIIVFRAPAGLRACALGLALLLPLSACGSDSGSTSTPTTVATTVATTTATTSATTGTTIPVATTEAATTTTDATTTSATTTSGTVAITAPVDAVGTVTHGTLELDGGRRTYRLYVPSALPAGPVPLFVGLHGGTGWDDQFATTNHIERLAESNGFIVVHPDGVQAAGGPGGVWNAGLCCARAVREDVDDVSFVNTLLDQLMIDHAIDPNRVFAFGHSNGGMMSYRLACELGDRIVGIGVVAATLAVDDCDLAEPVSIIHVHGTADTNVPIAGGRGADSLVGIDFPAPMAGFETLAALDGCSAPVVVTTGDVTTDRREPCAAGTAAMFVTIASANHAWPGGTPIIAPAVGAGYPDYDATAEIVTFLLGHPRP
ncbi:MAG: PHB depolymerase family esterase [Acidimicrobiia bacterium]